MLLTDGNRSIEIRGLFVSADCRQLKCTDECCWNTFLYEVEVKDGNDSRISEEDFVEKNEWMSALLELIRVARGDVDMFAKEFECEHITLAATASGDDIHFAVNYGHKAKCGIIDYAVCQKFTRVEALRFLLKELESYEKITCDRAEKIKKEEKPLCS